jgi:hypothetical protein
VVGYYSTYDCLASGYGFTLSLSPDTALVPVIQGTIRSTMEGQGDPAHGTLELKNLGVLTMVQV